MVDVLEHQNKVELLGTYGGDEAHAMSAWTSTSREITEGKRKRIPELLAMLASAGHHTPFEKSFLHFLVTGDTASHIHIIKHRIGVNVNGESARYKELKDDKYYLPDDWPNEERNLLIASTEESLKNYHLTMKTLEEKGFTRKRAKESSRFFLPYNVQVKLDVGFNFRSFMHFQSLRNKPDAQKEIQEIAQKMLELVWSKEEFQYSLEAFGYARPK